jgi:hypothetical protein
LKQFEIRVDASGIGLGAVLLQDGKPVAFESRRFTDAERNYSVGKQELFAVVHARTMWRCSIEGSPHPVKTVTDHLPLTYLPTKGYLSPRQTRWSERLSRFNLEWTYRPGKSNMADPLSRKPFNLMVVTRARDRTASEQAPQGAAVAALLVAYLAQRRHHVRAGMLYVVPAQQTQQPETCWYSQTSADPWHPLGESGDGLHHPSAQDAQRQDSHCCPC